MTPRVLVIGAGGQLGGAMASALAGPYDVVAATRTSLDITAPGAALAVTTLRPSVIVNCSAYTAVDAAEEHPVEALATNALAVRTLARVAADIDATLVHFSTDFVFDGQIDRPYEEGDAPNPRSTYGSSKLLGEWFAMETPRHYVLRVESLFGGPLARSSIDKIIDAIRSGSEVRAFVDRTVSPSYVADVVQATAALLRTNAPHGLYHCVNTGWTTWMGLARHVATQLGREDARIVPVHMADAGLLAGRPQFAALSNAKLAAAGVPMPTWQDAVARHLRS